MIGQVSQKSFKSFKPIHWFLKSNTQCNGKKLVINKQIEGDFLLIKN